jgi:hypothetical protein
VLGELRALSRGDGIVAMGRRPGGAIADTWLITYTDGAAVVGKTVTAVLPGAAYADDNSRGYRPESTGLRPVLTGTK